uniref:GYF domain-containing protein n=1 Tax=Cuerna arida TaxID=1464854 RepID=A0A1B6GNW5_9HEMI
MATKRKFEGDDNDSTDILDTNWRDKPIKTTITKYSLDSDEEDDNDGKTYNILDEDEIEGQEEGLAGIEGGIQITPFNMKEEMEEGHFDTDGMYHWKKDGKVVRDNWLENIDWVKVHNRKQGSIGDSKDEDSNELPSAAPSQYDDISVYREIIPFMKPKETVAKSLRRLAGNHNKPISSAERWKRKKAGIDTSKEEEEAKLNVSKLTELANKILQNTGNMDVYQESYEYITEKIDLATRKKPEAKSAELDMYSDDFDTKEKERLETKDTPSTYPSSTQSDTTAKPPEDSGEVTWEFKLEKDSTEISGPHSSEQMQKWTDEGRFKKEVWVRKCGQDGDFYTSKRIDFDLYI